MGIIWKDPIKYNDTTHQDYGSHQEQINIARGKARNTAEILGLADMLKVEIDKELGLKKGAK